MLPPRPEFATTEYRVPHKLEKLAICNSNSEERVFAMVFIVRLLVLYFDLFIISLVLYFDLFIISTQLTLVHLAGEAQTA